MTTPRLRRARRSSSPSWRRPLVAGGARGPGADARPRARGDLGPRAVQLDPTGSSPAAGRRSTLLRPRVRRRRAGRRSSTADEDLVRTLDERRRARRGRAGSPTVGRPRRRRAPRSRPGRYRLLVELPERGPRDDLAAADQLERRRLRCAARRGGLAERLGARAGGHAGRLRRRGGGARARRPRARLVAMAVALARRPGARARRRLGRAAGRRLPRQPGAGRRALRRRRARARGCWRRSFAAARRRSRSPRSRSCRCGSRSRSAARPRTCWSRSTW